MPQPERVAAMPGELPVIEGLGRLYRRVVIGTLLQNVVAGAGWMVWQTWRLAPRRDPQSATPTLIAVMVLVLVASIGLVVSRWAGRLAQGVNAGLPTLWQMLLLAPGLSFLGMLGLTAVAARWFHARGIILDALGPTRESLQELWLRTASKPVGTPQQPPAPPGGPPPREALAGEILYWTCELRLYARECRVAGWDDESIVQALATADYEEDWARRLVETVAD
jgi:hypothetical protein